MKRKRKAWAKSFGSYGNKIRIFEDPTSKILYAEMRDPSLPCGYRCRSLRHRDRKHAERWAQEQVAKLVSGDDALRDPTPRVARVIVLYLTHKTPLKVKSERSADERRAKMWTRVLGADMDLSKLSEFLWEQFIQQRRSGAIDSAGNPTPEDKRKPVRDGTIWSDLVFLTTVMNSATRWRDKEGRYLMRENPARGFAMPKDKNPRRPVATEDRFQKLRAVAPKVMMVVGRGRDRRETQSFLLELLDLANGTGRRVSAIVALQYGDLQLDKGPYGSIRWRADTDKTGRETLIPVNEDVRAAIDRIQRDRPGVGAAFIFPSPKDPTKHVSKELASTWMQRAEKLAKLPSLDGGLWHAYRRKWVNERKHLSNTDVAASGGWSDTGTLRDVYQVADEATMYQVVSNPRVLREA